MVTICGNTETLRDSIDRRFDDSIRNDAAESLDYSDLATLAGEVDFEISDDFREWHGGRFAEQAEMYGNRIYGRVAYQQDGEQSLAEKISNGIDFLLNSRAAEIKKSWDAAAGE